MGHLELSAMLPGIANGGAKSMVRVQGYHDRGGIQQALDMGADGLLVPYINSADEARQAVVAPVIRPPGRDRSTSRNAA
jgi:4-hydroxy-2-oxoheptanedioate aldolase